MKAVIIGAGMGGLTAAIALRQIGIETQVYERISENKPVGAAISVWSNASGGSASTANQPAASGGVAAASEGTRPM